MKSYCPRCGCNSCEAYRDPSSLARWRNTTTSGAPRRYRQDGLFAFRLHGPDGWEYFFRTATGRLSYGPYASWKAAQSAADWKFRIDPKRYPL